MEYNKKKRKYSIWFFTHQLPICVSFISVWLHLSHYQCLWGWSFWSNDPMIHEFVCWVCLLSFWTLTILFNHLFFFNSFWFVHKSIRRFNEFCLLKLSIRSIIGEAREDHTIIILAINWFISNFYQFLPPDIKISAADLQWTVASF